MAFDTLALIFACFMGVPGVLFMIKNTETAKNAEKEAGFSLDASGLALASYYLFLTGMVLFSVSMLTLGITIGLPAPLAVTAALSGPLTILGYMAIMKVSITGIPGIAGPPMPARIALLVIGTVLHANVIMHIFDGDITGLEWEKFIAVYFVALCAPHMVAMKHRSAASAMV